MPPRAYPDELQKWSNSQMVQTATIAARGVVRPPRSLAGEGSVASIVGCDCCDDSSGKAVLKQRTDIVYK